MPVARTAGFARADGVDDIDQAGDPGGGAGFLGQFAQGGFRGGLAIFDLAAGQRPLALIGRFAAPDQQHLLAAENDDAGAGDGTGRICIRMGSGHHPYVALMSPLCALNVTSRSTHRLR